jgi:hypothetical protein
MPLDREGPDPKGTADDGQIGLAGGQRPQDLRLASGERLHRRARGDGRSQELDVAAGQRPDHREAATIMGLPDRSRASAWRAKTKAAGDRPRVIQQLEIRLELQGPRPQPLLSDARQWRREQRVKVGELPDALPRHAGRVAVADDPLGGGRGMHQIRFRARFQVGQQLPAPPPDPLPPRAR